MEGEPVRRTALWLLGGVLVFAALRLVFSYGGYELLATALQRLGVPLGPVDAWLFAALLVAGIVTITVLLPARRRLPRCASAAVAERPHRQPLRFRRRSDPKS
jgi:hypothetical protein